MSDYVAHLAKDADSRFTLCGEPWQGWQVPAAGHDTPDPVLPPHERGRPHVDVIRQCQACASRARDLSRALVSA